MSQNRDIDSCQVEMETNFHFTLGFLASFAESIPPKTEVEDWSGKCRQDWARHILGHFHIPYSFGVCRNCPCLGGSLWAVFAAQSQPCFHCASATQSLGLSFGVYIYYIQLQCPFFWVTGTHSWNFAHIIHLFQVWHEFCLGCHCPHTPTFSDHRHILSHSSLPLRPGHVWKQICTVLWAAMWWTDSKELSLAGLCIQPF